MKSKWSFAPFCFSNARTGTATQIPWHLLLLCLLLATVATCSAAPISLVPVPLYSFKSPDFSSDGVVGNVIEGTDGVLYGVSSGGGQDGTVFKINKNGSGYLRLKRFSSTTGEGRVPEGALIEGQDGMLYGTTTLGGDFNAGTIFRLSKNGTDYVTLKHFGGFPGDGQTPRAALLEGSDGLLYGTTGAGGANGEGVVFKLSLDGSGFAILQNSGSTAPVIEGSDGALYGTTDIGGAGRGSVFKLNRNGGGFTVLWSFATTNPGGVTDGEYPYSALVEGNDGVLYGTTTQGGASGRGVVFKLNMDGSNYSIMRSFLQGDGGNSRFALVEGSDGALYGSTHSLGNTFPNPSEPGTIFRLEKSSGAFTVLRFSDFAVPLIEGSDGALYGTTMTSVFKLNKNGSGFATLWTFSPPTQSDAANPDTALLEASDGFLYGTTSWGGSASAGAAFKIRKDGSGYAILRSFSPPGTIRSALTEGSDGALYGTTRDDGNFSYGTVYKFAKNGGGYTVLHHFQAPGASIYSRLLAGTDGALYGTTLGTVFKLSNDGSGYTILRSFSNTCCDGISPGPLLEGSDGLLYGTTLEGGSANSGTIFRMNKDGTGYATLWNFNPAVGDGETPLTLIEASDGLLYGTGSTFFRISKSGEGFTVLKRYGGCAFTEPIRLATAIPGSLVEGGDGAIYGTTGEGVFRLSKDGSESAVVWSPFGNGLPYYLKGPLLKASDGMLYGTSGLGGDFDRGMVFTLRPGPAAPLTLSHVRVPEGDAGMTHAVFNLHLGSAQAGTVSVDFVTEDCFATAGSDYELTSGTVLFAPGETNKQIRVPVTGDVRQEDDMSFFLNLSNPTNVLLVATQWLATIANDDWSPVITTQPQSQTVRVGSNAVFSVNARGSAPLVYQWRQNGVDIAGATSSVLTLTDVQATENGSSFTVVVTNKVAARTSLPAALTVDTNTRPVLTLQPQSTNMIVRGTITFKVTATSTAPPLRYQWQFEGTNLDGETNNVLTISNVQLTNQGTYWCVVSDAVASINSDPARLNIVFRPEVVTPIQAQTNIAGDNVTFTVTVTNNATLPIGYEWRRFSLPLTNMILNSRTCTFTLFNVSTNDTANYRVVMTNAGFPVGGLSSAAALTVLPAMAPTALTLPASNLLPGGATLNASINPMGAVTKGWYDYGLTAAYGSRTPATIVGQTAGAIAFAQSVDSLLPGTNYHYRVVATNYGGMVLGGNQQFQTSATVARLTIAAYERLGDGQFRLRFEATPGAAYTVLFSSTLGEWTSVGPATETTPGQFEFTDAGAPGQATRFYQVRSP